MTRVQKAILIAGIVLIVSGPFIAEPFIFTLRELLISTGLSSNSGYGFCGAALALTCSVYTIFGTMLFGLALILSALIWWLIAKNRAERPPR